MYLDVSLNEYAFPSLGVPQDTSDEKGLNVTPGISSPFRCPPSKFI